MTLLANFATRAWASALGLSVVFVSFAGAQTDWTSYASTTRSTKYSAAAEIDRTNVHQLEVAWRWRSIDYAAASKHERLRVLGSFSTTPLMRSGRLLLATGLGVAAAADPTTGEVLWLYDPYTEGLDIRLGRSRGAVTWSDGTEERLIFLSNGDLVSLDTATGRPDPAFGRDGRVDPRDLGEHGGERRSYMWSSAPLVCDDTVVLGESTRDAWVRQKNPPGLIRGYDVRTGELLWVFWIVPTAGQEGYETWEAGSADYTGGTNVWSWMSCDEDLGWVYAATSTPSNDWYGGHRLGAGLYAESILSLKAKTGEKNWHFQAVHHGLWDFDFPAAPIVADVTIDGVERKIVAQPSKQAFLYVFDRVTGEPIWPIVELPVAASDVPGEEAWPTQPYPTWPLPYDLQGLRVNDLIDFTPELRAEALEYVSNYRIGPLFTPPGLVEGERAAPTIQVPGPVGGSNWNGAALDVESGILYVPSVTGPTIMGLRPPPDPARSDLRYRVDLSEADGYVWAQLPSGLPITKPPYGRITAIDLNTGEHVWMVPNGDGPRDHPELAHLDLPKLGQPGRASALVTKTLVFVADGAADMVVLPEGGGGRMFRAYDKATGELVWETELEAGVSAAPMSYVHEGRQYIVMALSEREHEHELIALALPDS